MRFITLGILLLTLSGHAQIASYVGAAPAGISNTPVLWSSGGSSGTVSLLYNAAFPTLTGAQYVTYKQGSAPAGLTTYTTTFQSTAGSTGSLQVMCDDSCTINVNGTQIGAITQYNSLKTFAIPALVDGTNTLSIAVTNLTGNTGVDFSGTLTAAPVPAPVPAKPAKTVVGKWSCTSPVSYTLYSDGTFDVSGTGNCTKQ